MIVIGLASTFLIYDAHASVTISGTRVVYPLGQREVTVKLDNDSLHPSLVQVWMDDGNAAAKPGDIQVPFVITPPIFRMEPKKSQVLRVMYSGEPLPSDRESVYWLNVLDIPPKAEDAPDTNALQFAFRIRIKLFVRPAKLLGKPEDAPASWTGRSWTRRMEKGWACACRIRRPITYRSAKSISSVTAKPIRTRQVAWSRLAGLKCSRSHDCPRYPRTRRSTTPPSATLAAR